MNDYSPMVENIFFIGSVVIAVLVIVYWLWDPMARILTKGPEIEDILAFVLIALAIAFVLLFISNHPYGAMWCGMIFVVVAYITGAFKHD